MIERSAERDAAIAAMLPYVAVHGWTGAALRRGLADAGAMPASADWLFAGPTDMVEAYIDFADRRMAAAAAIDAPDRLSGRIRRLIALRLAQAEPERAAVRRAASVLALPGNGVLAARTLARTVDAIWHAAGDRAADFSWYTKRASLAGVYGATLLRWLGDGSGGVETLAFLDRRLADLGRIGRLRGRLTGGLRPAGPDTHTQPPAA